MDSGQGTGALARYARWTLLVHEVGGSLQEHRHEVESVKTQTGTCHQQYQVINHVVIIPTLKVRASLSHFIFLHLISHPLLIFQISGGPAIIGPGTGQTQFRARDGALSLLFPPAIVAHLGQ